MAHTNGEKYVSHLKNGDVEHAKQGNYVTLAIVFLIDDHYC